MRALILGPLVVERDGVPVDLGGPRQRSVLAVLLLARGRVVSLDRLIDTVYGGDPPPGAVESIQAYISALRRVLEPDRPARAPAQVLISAAPGYAVRLPDEQVDAWRFAALAEAGRKAIRDQRWQDAVEMLGEALALWRGDVLADLNTSLFPIEDSTRLEELRIAAVTDIAQAELGLGRSGEAAERLSRLTRNSPLRERAWELYALALYRCGRQATRSRHARSCVACSATNWGSIPGRGWRGWRRRSCVRTLGSTVPLRRRQWTRPGRCFLPRGRTSGFATYSSGARRRCGICLERGRPGWPVRRRRCWWWAPPAPESPVWSTSSQRRVPTRQPWYGDAARRAPTGLLGELADARVLIVATVRDDDPSVPTALAATLGDLARQGARRVDLPPLSLVDVERYLAGVTGVDDRQSAARIFARTAGHPFFVVELVRLLISPGGAQALSADSPDVPGGVRDVVRARVGRLPGPTRTLLAAAAVLGDHATMELLEAASGLSGDRMLDAVEPALVTRIAVFPRADATLAFTHSLVRHAVAQEVTTLRRARILAAAVAAANTRDNWRSFQTNVQSRHCARTVRTQRSA